MRIYWIKLRQLPKRGRKPVDAFLVGERQSYTVFGRFGRQRQTARRIQTVQLQRDIHFRKRLHCHAIQEWRD